VAYVVDNCQSDNFLKLVSHLGIFDPLYQNPMFEITIITIIIVLGLGT
jgi:hypothetical protein